MKKLYMMLMLALFASVAFGEIVGTPSPTTSASLQATFVVSQSAGADQYLLSYTKNGTTQYSQTVQADTFPADGTFTYTFSSVFDGAVLCVKVAAKNAGGTTAYDQQCHTAALPPLPQQPVIVSLTVL